MTDVGTRYICQSYVPEPIWGNILEEDAMESERFQLLILIVYLCFWSPHSATSNGGVVDNDMCNEIAVQNEPKNVTCPLLIQSLDTPGCSLEEGDYVLWSIYKSQSDLEPLLQVYFGSNNNAIGTDEELLRSVYVSQTHKLIIPTVHTTTHSSLSCRIIHANKSGASECDREQSVQLEVVEGLGLSSISQSVGPAAGQIIDGPIGGPVVLCSTGQLNLREVEDQVEITWSSQDLNLTIPSIPLDPRQLSNETSCHPTGNDGGLYLDCACLNRNFRTLMTVQKATNSINTPYRAYQILYYNVENSLPILLLREDCLTFPNRYISLLVIDRVPRTSVNFKLDVRILNRAEFSRSVIINPVFAMVHEIVPIKPSQYSIIRGDNLLVECKANVSGNASLLWQRENGTFPITFHPIKPNTATSLNVSVIELCAQYNNQPVFAIVKDEEFRPRENGALVLHQTIVLVFCNAQVNNTDFYRCRSTDSPLFVSIHVQIDQLSANDMYQTIIIIVVCVLGLFVVLVIVLLWKVCQKYHSIRNSPLPMWPEEPNSPLVQRPFSPLTPVLPLNSTAPVEEDEYEFPREKLQLGSVLGEGQFGVVHRALAEGICSFDYGRKVVAVKTLKCNARPSDIMDLHSELDTMRRIEPHPNIINFLGVCSKPADQPLYILMEFAMYGSLKDYLKSVQTMKPHPEAPPPPESVYSQYLCPYHCQQILKYSGNHCYRNSNCDNTAAHGVSETADNSLFNNGDLLTPSPAHSTDVEPAVLAHITRVMKLLSTDYFYSSNNMPTIKIDCPSPEPEGDPHHVTPVHQALVSPSSTGGSVYSFDRLSNSCAYRPCPEGSSRSYSKHDNYYNTAYNHLEPRRKISESSTNASLLYPPSYINVPKSCKCHVTSDSADVSSCDSHVRSESMDSAADTESKSQKLFSLYYSSCVCCAQLNRTTSYRNLGIDKQARNPSSAADEPKRSEDVGDEAVRGDVVRSEAVGYDSVRGEAGKGEGSATGDKPGLSYFDLVDFAHQIARGMEHLEKMKCVHRDLAARNVLIAEGFLLKIGDFGLARDLNEGGKDYYRKITPGRIPARWMALESLEERIHSSKSDAWSYGVVIWEILTYGEFPYGKNLFANSIVSLIRHLREGNRLPKPPSCSDQIYDLLNMCWDEDPQKRPTFGQLVTFFQNLLDTSKEFLNLSVAEASYQSMARLLEANALEEIGQLTESNSQQRETLICARNPQFDNHQESISAESVTTCSHKQVPPHAPSQLLEDELPASSNLDSEGYLKLEVSSDQLLDTNTALTICSKDTKAKANQLQDPQMTVSKEPPQSIPQVQLVQGLGVCVETKL